MKYFFRSPEIYVKLKRSSMYPTNKDTPLVPIRGLWVTGIHRSIFDIDHVVQITDIKSSKCSAIDYSTIEKTIKDDGCSILGVVALNNNVNISLRTKKKYSGVGDSHGLFVAGLSTSRVSVTDQSSINE